MRENTPLPEGPRRKVLQALERIEQAQRLVLLAAEDLSDVNGFVHEWEATCQLHDTIKAHWYVVERRRAAAAGDIAGLP